MKSRQKIGIVIVSYNSSTELKACIKAAAASTKYAGLDGEIIVVDNHSKDDSCDQAKQAGAAVIANKQNTGFAVAVNQGIRKAFTLHCQYVLILNPDAILSKSALKLMKESFEPDQHVGAVGPSMVDKKGNSTTQGYYLKAPSWLSVLLFSTFLRPRALKHPRLVRSIYEETDLISDRSVAQIPGACLFTSRPVLDEVGLLDEDFAIWYEDVEWCYRARKHHYAMMYCHKAVVEHVGGVSFEKWQSLDKAVTFYVSMKTFFRKHKLLSYPLVIAIVLLNSLALYIRHGDRSNLIFAKKFLSQKRGVLPT